jgi:hypothetical protein
MQRAALQANRPAKRRKCIGAGIIATAGTTTGRTGIIGIAGTLTAIAATCGVAAIGVAGSCAAAIAAGKRRNIKF